MYIKTAGLQAMSEYVIFSALNNFCNVFFPRKHQKPSGGMHADRGSGLGTPCPCSECSAYHEEERIRLNTIATLARAIAGPGNTAPIVSGLNAPEFFSTKVLLWLILLAVVLTRVF
jgi:hypothetical protein